MKNGQVSRECMDVFALSFYLRRYGMLNLRELCNLLMSIQRKTTLYSSAR